MKSKCILLLDNDPHFLDLLEVFLQSLGYETIGTQREEEFLTQLVARSPVVVIVDWKLDGRSGTELLPQLVTQFPDTPVILSTAYSSLELAVRSMKLGAFDFLPKPVDEARLATTVANAIKHAELQRQLKHPGLGLGKGAYEGMIAISEEMCAIFTTIESLATTPASVLVTGESGTGKELVARAIHNRSKRTGPFVALNMAAIPQGLVESTLFGHERGSFSGASQRRLGACEEAHNGTLFLDEIGEMPIDLQPKLLRFLEQHVIRRVGGDADIPLDVRIVSATNREPRSMVDSGSMRNDIYYRLNVIPIRLPPLRERRKDIALLASNKLVKLSRHYGKEFKSFDSQALECLESYPWPGNVRELLHLVERTVITNSGTIVESHMLPPLEMSQWIPSASADRNSASVNDRNSALHNDKGLAEEQIVSLAELERNAICHAIEACGGNRLAAALALGISTATIYRKLKSYGLTARFRKTALAQTGS
jgi:two-component system, repressor protein LuxO